MTPVIGVSLKAYLGLAQTREWVAELARGLEKRGTALEIFVLPSYLSVADCRKLLEPYGVGVGAQDVSAYGLGAYTGEVPAEILVEAGVRYAEVGHAERRRLLGEDDEMIAAKAAAAARAGITPIVCIGETRFVGSKAAIEECIKQLHPVLYAVPETSPLIVAYEPVWAIGVERPAPVQHIQDVTRGLKQLIPTRRGTVSIIYGGSAGSGLYSQLDGAVDGLFLGRFAHDIGALQAIIAEVETTSEPRKGARNDRED